MIYPPCSHPSAGGNNNKHNGEEHPILDMNTDDIKPFDEHMHKHFPDVVRKIEVANRRVYYFYLLPLCQLARPSRRLCRTDARIIAANALTGCAGGAV
jgi:hypothetical protein